MRGVPSILFDLDGTLLDTLDDLADAMNASLADEGLPTHAVDAYRYFVGDGVDMLARRSAGAAADDPARFARLVAGQRRHYREGWKRKTRPYPGIDRMLAGLAARKANLAVLSNKPDDFTRLIIAEYFPGDPFIQVRGARGDVPRKPDPAGALAIARAVGVEPGGWLYLGDTDTDMKTAVAAGMRPLGAGWGFRPASELLGAGATAVLARPEAMLEAAFAGKSG